MAKTKKKAAAKKKKAAKAKAAAKKKSAKKTTAKKRAVKKSAKKKPSKTPNKNLAPKEPIGRPKITGEERLDMLFRHDYQARQIFEFLRVDRVKELERYEPQEIVKQLSQPIRQTVDRIRAVLAQRNRCLAGDEEFVAKFKEKQSG